MNEWFRTKKANRLKETWINQFSVSFTFSPYCTYEIRDTTSSENDIILCIDINKDYDRATAS